MSSTLSPGEKAQLEQTIEMFEVITQSQPQDYQSLEILKEAYTKLGRDVDVIKTSKRIAEAYVQLGQLSSAILEYETILQHHADDPDVLAALKAIERKASNVTTQPAHSLDAPAKAETAIPFPGGKAAKSDKAKVEKAAGKPGADAALDDGRAAMHKVFVESKIISPGDFDLCWHTPDLQTPPTGPVETFVQILADKGIAPADKTLKTLADKTRLAYLPLDKYDIDADITRAFPAEVCRRWCVLPFDRMSKSVLVATTNPYNQQAARELAAATPYRLIWYLAMPEHITNNLKKVFR